MRPQGMLGFDAMMGSVDMELGGEAARAALYLWLVSSKCTHVREVDVSANFDDRFSATQRETMY